MKHALFLTTAALTLGAAIQGSHLQAGGSDAKSTADGPDGARLWAQNCTRCHNNRPQKSFSDAQWDTIVHHMRIRGNLTGVDARAIVEFMKDGN